MTATPPNGTTPPPKLEAGLPKGLAASLIRIAAGAIAAPIVSGLPVARFTIASHSGVTLS